MGPGGTIDANSCQIKFSEYPLGGTSISCGGQTFSAPAGANLSRNGDTIIVQNGGASALPSQVINTNGSGYALNYNSLTHQVITTPIGGPDTSTPSGALEWLYDHGVQSSENGLGGVTNDINKAIGVPAKRDNSSDPGNGQSAVTTGSDTGAPPTGSYNSTGVRNYTRYNSDGSGRITTHNADGSSAVRDFNSIEGCARLGQYFGIPVDAVAAYPQECALRYMVDVSGNDFSWDTGWQNLGPHNIPGSVMSNVVFGETPLERSLPAAPGSVVDAKDSATNGAELEHDVDTRQAQSDRPSVAGEPANVTADEVLA